MRLSEAFDLTYFATSLRTNRVWASLIYPRLLDRVHSLSTGNLYVVQEKVLMASHLLLTPGSLERRIPNNLGRPKP